MGECTEPRCSRPTAKDWKGKAVCEDCYDKYEREEEEFYAKHQMQ